MNRPTPIPHRLLLPAAALACLLFLGDARAGDEPAKKPAPAGYMTFAVNVHDFRNLDDSAATILRLIGLFEKYGAKGDFYLTAPMVELYAQKRPDVIARLRDSGMTISYHLRPPHPVYTGFDRALRQMSDEELARTLRDYETYRLDLATGGLDRSAPGGYSYVAKVFGRAPVVVSTNGADPRIKTAGLKIYREMGAKMCMAYHESGTDPEKPFEFRDGLLIRPSDFSITRWKTGNMQRDQFWWNMLGGRAAGEYDPVAHLKQEMADWKGKRAPFVTALIHENNFYCRGAESWTPIYYVNEDKSRPARPPYDLEAQGSSQKRSKEEKEAIFAAYERLVEYAVKNLEVVTSEGVLALAGK